MDQTNRRILIIDLFYEEFANACDKLINLIDSKDERLDKKKIEGGHIIVSKIPFESSGTPYSGLATGSPSSYTMSPVKSTNKKNYPNPKQFNPQKTNGKKS